MHVSFLFIMLVFAGRCAAQELYVFSDPASSRPAKSLAFNLTARYPGNSNNSFFLNRYTTQAIAGISKNLTVAAGAGFSNYYQVDKLQFDGVRAYGKYRFLSIDDVHTHFRMAAFVKGGMSTHAYVFDEMTLEGDNDGISAGVIATQLYNRLAVSATTSYTKVFVKDASTHHDVLNHSSQMISYSLSSGYLLLPREYTDYKQLNLNLYLELLGDKCIDNNQYTVDLAPAVQFIFNSTTRINLGARFQLGSNMLRVGQRTIEVGLERTILNAWK